MALVRAFAENRPSIGMWQMMPDANVSRLLARSGCEWVMVDCEHGYISGSYARAQEREMRMANPSANARNDTDAGMHATVPAIAAAGASPIVRLPDMQPWMVKRTPYSPPFFFSQT